MRKTVTNVHSKGSCRTPLWRASGEGSPKEGGAGHRKIVSAICTNMQFLT